MTLCLYGETESKDEATFPLAADGQPFPWHKMRLPETIKPLHYDLHIHPNLTSLDFTGTVEIQLEVLQNTDSIILHSKNLQISKAVLLESDKRHPLKVLELPAFEQVALVTDALSITSGRRYRVRMDFAANLSDSFHGFYKSSYRTREGEVRQDCCLSYLFYLFFCFVVCSLEWLNEAQNKLLLTFRLLGFF